jgi:hypothetical protein
VIALDLNTLILDGGPVAVAKALSDLDKKIALVELFDARFKELATQLADGSDEAVEEAFKQASLEVFGKDLTGERWTPEVVTT